MDNYVIMMTDIIKYSNTLRPIALDILTRLNKKVTNWLVAHAVHNYDICEINRQHMSRVVNKINTSTNVTNIINHGKITAIHT